MTRRRGSDSVDELDDLLAALSQSFCSAQQALERLQHARLLELCEKVIGGPITPASVTITVPEAAGGDSIEVPLLDLVSVYQHAIAELVVEFDCVPTLVRTPRGRRLGLRVVRPGSNRRVHRARVLLAARPTPRMEFSLDGHLVRCELLGPAAGEG